MTRNLIYTLFGDRLYILKPFPFCSGTRVQALRVKCCQIALDFYPILAHVPSSDNSPYKYSAVQNLKDGVFVS